MALSRGGRFTVAVVAALVAVSGVGIILTHDPAAVFSGSSAAQREIIAPFPPGATPLAPLDSAVLAPLATTTSGVHLGLVFNSQVGDPATEAGKVDLVWGALNATGPEGVVNLAYVPFDRIGDNTTGPLYSVAWFQQHHPDWLDYQCDKTTLSYLHGEPNAPLDYTNPAVLQFLMQQEYIPLLKQGYAGLAFDNLDFTNWGGYRCGHYDLQHHWIAQFTGEWNDPTYRAALDAWGTAIRQLIHQYQPTAIIAMNYPYDFDHQPDSYILLGDMDLLADERGFTNWGDATTPHDIADQKWFDYVHALLALSASGRGAFIINEEPQTPPTRAEIQWALANYLLVKGDHTYMSISGVQQYGALVDFPEEHAAIGSPTGPLYQDNCLYRRDFTGGTALVNPSSKATCHLTLHGGPYHDLYGHAVTAVTLAPTSAIVLLMPATGSGG